MRKECEFAKEGFRNCKSGSAYIGVGKDKREFGQNLSVLEVCLEDTYDVGSKLLKRLL